VLAVSEMNIAERQTARLRQKSERVSQKVGLLYSSVQFGMVRYGMCERVRLGSIKRGSWLLNGLVSTAQGRWL
jgi:hypothetical protein